MKSPSKYWLTTNPTTLADVFDKEYISIRKLRTLTSEAVVNALIYIMLDEFSKFFSVEKMSDWQKTETAKMINAEYPMLTVDDLKLFLYMCRMGAFGIVYNRLDGAIIFEWLKKYWNYRCETTYQENIKNKPKEESNAITYEVYQEIKKRAEAGDAEAIKRLKKR